MKIATYSIVLVQLFSIFLGWSIFSIPLRIVGIILGVIGDSIFAISVYTMKDSWRAGIAEYEKTKLVTKGIYNFSRNPAFLGFDFMYIGILLLFFNPLLLIFTVFVMVMLHLQILQEEVFLTTLFGGEYQVYCSKVRRYLGRKK